MQIAIDNNGVITGYAKIGNIAGGIECTVDIPDDFAPGKYILNTEETEDGTEYSYIVPNPDYVEDRTPEITDEQRISAMEDAVAELIEMMLGGDE